MQLTKLKTSGLVEPLGIDRPPYFSWIIESSQKNTLQEAYQIIVSDDSAIYWDSGRVTTRKQAFVQYAGHKLRAKTRYRWSITVWDNHGNQSETESRFETAFLNENDWCASWVESTIPRTENKKYEYGNQPPPVLFSRCFSLEKQVKTARLFATAYGTYRAMLNGVRSDDREFAPEHTVYRSVLYYQTYDVTALLQTGENELSMYVGDGWYFCPASRPIGEKIHNAPAVLYQLEIEYEDGSRETVASDGSEICRTWNILFSDIFRGEKQDASLGYGEVCSVRIMDYGYAMLHSQPMPPVRPMRLLPALRLYQTPGGEHIVDFGQLLCGRARVSIAAPKGREITFEYFEVTQKDGSYFNSMYADQKDIYISDGSPCEYEAVFTFHGFRYIRVTGLDFPKKEDFIAVLLTTEKENTGSFTCSDERLNRLYENVRWSQASNMLSIPTDCPSRERAGFTGDIQIYAATALLNEDVTPFLSSWLINLAADQTQEGAVPITVPFTKTYENLMLRVGKAFGNSAVTGVAGWGDAAVIVPYQMYRLTGNELVLEEHYETMRRWCDYIIRTAAEKRGDNALPTEIDRYLWNTGFHFGEWLIPSQPEAGADFDICKESAEYIAPIFAWLSIRLMSEISGVLNKQEKDYYTDIAEKMKNAIQCGLMTNCSMPRELMGAYVLSIALDLVPKQYKGAFADRLIHLLEENGGCLDTGFLATPYLLDALVKVGRRDLALEVLWQEKQPSWLFEINHGATAMWESWFSLLEDGAPKMTSYNHYAFGCVDDWIFRNIVGIGCLEPGFRHFSVFPQNDTRLDWCRRSIACTYGTISLSWSKERLELCIPCNTRATVFWKGKSYELGSGQYELS